MSQLVKKCLLCILTVVLEHSYALLWLILTCFWTDRDARALQFPLYLHP